MPRKGKKTAKKREKIKDKDKELELLFQDLKNNREKGESGLEEESEDFGINLGDLEFHQFVNPQAAGAPVLERRASAGPREIPSSSQESRAQSGERNEGGVVYEQRTGDEYGNLESQYQAASEPPVLRPSDFSEQGSRVEFQDPLAGRGIQRWNSEPDKFSVESVQGERRRLPFESQEKKYKEFKPRKVR